MKLINIFSIIVIVMMVVGCSSTQELGNATAQFQQRPTQPVQVFQINNDTPVVKIADVKSPVVTTAKTPTPVKTPVVNTPPTAVIPMPATVEAANKGLWKARSLGNARANKKNRELGKKYGAQEEKLETTLAKYTTHSTKLLAGELKSLEEARAEALAKRETMYKKQVEGMQIQYIVRLTEEERRRQEKRLADIEAVYKKELEKLNKRFDLLIADAKAKHEETLAQIRATQEAITSKKMSELDAKWTPEVARWQAILNGQDPDVPSTGITANSSTSTGK